MKPVLVAFGLALISSTALADDFYWSHKDWSVSVQKVPSEEDDHDLCKASTGGDGEPFVYIEFFTGDAGPPYSYPALTVNEYAPRGYKTLLQDGDTVSFAFDDGTVFQGSVQGGLNDDGLYDAFGMPPQDKGLQVLQAMRRNNTMTISGGDRVLYTASLSGFSAAYGKMADVCGFSTEGVLE